MTFEKTNPRITRLIGDLKAASRENGAPLWRDIAKRLEKPSRNYAAVNLSKINRHTQSNDTVLVAGKVLASGDLEHSVTVAALNFSSQAMPRSQKPAGSACQLKSWCKSTPRDQA